jgi:hypothetical protein
MKKTITTTAFIAALLFFGSFAANATNPERIEKNAKENARLEIINRIACPDFVQTNDPANQVKALVQIDSTGNVKVEQINSANPQLKAYVIDQLQNMKLKSPGQNQRFILVINFEVS